MLCNHAISVTKGDDFSICITRTVDGEPAPFADNDRLVLFLKVSVDGKILIERDAQIQDGDAYFLFRPEDTKDLARRSYIYEVKLTESDGTIMTIVPIQPIAIRGDLADANLPDL